MEEKELSLYVHIPFCKKKCAYCDFLSAPASEEVREGYINALCEEIGQEAAFYRDYRVKTVFLGGGTPSVLTAGQLKRILCKLKESFSFSRGESVERPKSGRLCKDSDSSFKAPQGGSWPEVTIECNPGTASKETLNRLRRAGVNRLSIGLQSACDDELKALGRIHTWQDFIRTFRAAREAGFHNINVDVMSALPGQSMESYRHTLEEVLALSPEHISAYSLIIEEGTPFYVKYGEADRQRRLDGEDTRHLLPSEEEERQMYDMTREMLAERGYRRYEISNYARSGYECQHNITYWRRGNYLGLGLGASSLIENCRFQKTEDLKEYLKISGNNVMSTEDHHKRMTEEGITGKREGRWPPKAFPPYCRNIRHLTRSEQMEEFMFLGLRMMSGISCRAFREYFQVSVEEVYGDVLGKLTKKKLIAKEGGRICLTKFGVDISNVVLAEFLL